jgi:epoxyqueuosine reductase
MERAVEPFYSFLEERGFKGRIVSIRHLHDLQNEIENHHRQGIFDEEFFQEALSFFSFHPPDNLPSAASIIVVAVPRPQTKLIFTRDGNTLAVTLPPTYMRYWETDKQVVTISTEWLASRGYHTASANLPKKLLAVCSGLAEYGRNNITYVPGMGSCHQLIAFCSDFPCQEDEWREPRMLDSCRECRVCLTKCPTGAIVSEHFLIRAERCLVFHNERSLDHPFPGWIEPTSHNCLIGCMLCQRPCPENKDFLEWFEGNEAFSHEETILFLNGASSDQLPAETQEKLKRLGMPDLLGILPRNLMIFFDRQ